MTELVQLHSVSWNHLVNEMPWGIYGFKPQIKPVKKMG